MQGLPRGMSFAEGRWEVTAIHPGHFLAPASEDALVSGSGCESHAEGLGGSFLLSRDGASWRKIRYTAGMIASDCKKLSSIDRRDRLVCGSSDCWQGDCFPRLDLFDPGDAMFGLEDTMGSLLH